MVSIIFKRILKSAMKSIKFILKVTILHCDFWYYNGIIKWSWKYTYYFVEKIDKL